MTSKIIINFKSKYVFIMFNNYHKYSPIILSKTLNSINKIKLYMLLVNMTLFINCVPICVTILLKITWNSI